MMKVRPRNNFLRSLTLIVSITLGLASCAKPHCPLEEIVRANSDGESQKIVEALQYPVKEQVIEESFWNSHRSFIYWPESTSGETFPIVLFLHGYFDSKPDKYEAMLRYYASQGYVVVYPSFGNLLHPSAWPDNALTAFDKALTYLEKSEYVNIDRQRTAFVGHSIGGILSLHLANRLAKEKSPWQPKVIVTTDAAGISTPAYSKISIDDLSSIPQNTRLVMMMAEESFEARKKIKDQCLSDGQDYPWACNAVAVNVRALRRTPQIPPNRKSALLMKSNVTSENSLRSDHNAAQGVCGDEDNPINALDVKGYWQITSLALREEIGEARRTKNDELSQDSQTRFAQDVTTCLITANCTAL